MQSAANALAGVLTAALARRQRHLLWCVTYVFSLGLMYLFHSPFRAHAGCRTDWYAQVTKILQLWLGVVVLCFHSGLPLFSRTQRAPHGAPVSHAARAIKGQGPTHGPEDAEDDTTLVLVTVFPALTLFFLLLHKFKRRLQLGVTFGPGFTIVVLNSILLTGFSMMHVAVCTEVLETSGTGASPLTSRSRGLTVYTAPQLGFAVLRHVVCPPHPVVNFPFTSLAHLLLVNLLFVVLDYQYKARKGFDPSRGILFSELYDLHKREDGEPAPARGTRPAGSPRRAAPPSTWWWSWWWWHLTRNSARMREANRRYDFRYAEPTPTRVAATAPGRAGAAVSSPQAPSARSPNSPLSMSSSLSERQRMGGRLEESASFPMTYAEVADVLACQHPDNKTGMVPWFSTFVLNATWQAASYEALEFLVFDARLLEERKSPKVFDLTYYANLAQLDSARRARRSSHCECARLHSETASSCALLSDQSTPPSPSMTETVAGPAEATSRSGDAVTGSDEDVWFDWIADVGDGFNSTYEMARLLAQPALWLPDESCRARGRTKKDLALAELLPSVPNEPRRTVTPTQAGHSRRSSTPTAAASRKDAHASGEDFLREHATARVQRHSVCMSRSAIPEAGVNGDASALQPAFSAPTMPRRDDERGEQSAGVGAGLANDTAFSSVSSPSSRNGGSRTLPHSNKRMHYLPRGSFVLVGGDLAYPNPNDETFLTRFIGPYSDALRPHPHLQHAFRAHYREIVEADAQDSDLAHVRMLDAVAVARISRVAGPSLSPREASLRATTLPQALRSTPLLFAIPGNHEWLDGLTTYRKFILDSHWVGGWALPQRTSYFVLKLPCNWFILCTDGGNHKDIDRAQGNYFLSVIDTYMNEESCVVLTSHEPGWVYDAMLRRDKALQPELNRLAAAIGTRLRLWLAGDVHHYSRHIPRDPLSEAPTLVVSGGGGAFMHGPRRSDVIHQGTEYTRVKAFPHGNTYLSLLSRLLGFRFINWKFDFVVGACCFLLVVSMLPQPYYMEPIEDLPDMMCAWMRYTGTLIAYLFSHGVISLIVAIGFLVAFASAGAEHNVPVLPRLVNGVFWTLLVLVACCGMLSYLECALGYLAANDMLVSTSGRWGSVFERETRLATDSLLNHSRELLGPDTTAARVIEAAQHTFYGSGLSELVGIVLRCMDPVETLAYLSVKVSSPTAGMGETSPSASRTDVVLYYLHFLFVYWIIVTPIVSFLIGCFLFVSATAFDCLFDAAYSAFQIEDYKQFVRFRIDSKTRELHGYVVAEKNVPKVWELDPAHAQEISAGCSQGPSGRTDTHERDHGGVPPPHLCRHPSRWKPSHRTGDARSVLTAMAESFFLFGSKSKRVHGSDARSRTEVLEHFVCRPHTLERRGSAARAATNAERKSSSGQRAN